MGKVKQQLEEDMMLHPELYGPDESDYMSEEELKRQYDEIQNVIEDNRRDTL